jgi:hypothetical protein
VESKIAPKAHKIAALPQSRPNWRNERADSRKLADVAALQTDRGHADRGTGILNNALYVGRPEWNRCSYIKYPRTGGRVARPNPRDEWEIVEVLDLRIVDDALWERVKERQ